MHSESDLLLIEVMELARTTPYSIKQILKVTKRMLEFAQMYNLDLIEMLEKITSKGNNNDNTSNNKSIYR